MLPAMWGENVNSEVCLGSFLHWWGVHATPKEQEACSELYIIIHYDGEEHGTCGCVSLPGCTAEGGRRLPERRCAEPGCARCLNGWGGYRFNWIHPAWSCANVVPGSPKHVQQQQLGECSGFHCRLHQCCFRSGCNVVR